MTDYSTGEWYVATRHGVLDGRPSPMLIAESRRQMGNYCYAEQLNGVWYLVDDNVNIDALKTSGRVIECVRTLLRMGNEMPTSTWLRHETSQQR